MSTENGEKSVLNNEKISNGETVNCDNDDNDEKVVYTNRSAHLVQNVRDMFLKEYEKDKSQFYEEDVEKIKTDDWFVKRYLIARNRNEKNTVKMLIAAMRWRRNENVREQRPNMFPAEFYKLGGLFVYENDKEGNITVYFRIKFIFRIPEITEALKRFSAFLMYTIYDNMKTNGLTAVVDFHGTGLKNCEFTILRFVITILQAYLPAGVNHILVVDLPAVLRAFWFTTKGWIAENRRKLLKFVTRETILEFIDKENLPKFLGGTCTRPYRGDEMIPENCISGIDYGVKTGVPEERCKEIYAYYETYFDEKD